MGVKSLDLLGLALTRMLEIDIPISLVKRPSTQPVRFKDPDVS